MKTASMAQAKSHLSALISQAAAGEEIVITKRGSAIARLVAEPAQPFGWDALEQWTKQEELPSMTEMASVAALDKNMRKAAVALGVQLVLQPA